MRHTRRSLRLNQYDYTALGAYFITICTYKRRCLFGEVRDDVMQLSAAGTFAEEEWMRTEKIRDEIELDAFVIMPNHIHAVVWIVETDGAKKLCSSQEKNASGADRSNYPSNDAPDNPRSGDRLFAAPTRGANGPAPRSISALVAGYKSAVTMRINRHRCTPGEPVWQRNYYEHIIRNEKALDTIRYYIVHNPLQWALDRYHP